MGSSPREHEADGEYECIDRLIGASSDICRFQQTNQTSLDVNELVFLYMVAKLLSTCAKVLHYNKEMTKSATKRIR
jgi:hypothetical protein